MPSKPLTVTGFDHVVLRVRDLDRAVDFYRGVLGLQIECLEEYRAGSRPFPSARAGDQLIDLLPDPTYNAAEGMRASGFVHFCVRVAEGLESEVLPRLRAAGVEAIDEVPERRLGASGYGRSIYVRDPDGYVVELKEDAPA